MLDDDDGLADSLQPITIAGAAELCLCAFQQCLHLSTHLHPREFSSIEDQLARFSSWASGIGVFARGRASMDHRLREASEVRDAIIDLLETLSDSIQDSLSVLQDDVTSSRTGDLEDAPTVSNNPLKLFVHAAADDISLLYRLTNTIRRASKESQNLKAAKSYRIRDDDGNDAEPILEEVFANYIYGRFPSINDGLRKRLASSMVLRRRRIMYRRSRYGSSPIKPASTIPQPKLDLPESQQQIVVSFQGPDDSAGTSTAKDSAPAKSTVQSVAVSATTLAAEDYKRASSPSMISTTKTVAIDNHGELVFPPPPNGSIRRKFKALKKALLEQNDHLKTQADTKRKASDGMLQPSGFNAEKSLQRSLEEAWDRCNTEVPEVACPFCLYALSSLSVSDEKKWKAHVMNDLDAYVCLFDECDKPEELYLHNRDWLKHMRAHTLRWRCNSKAHGTIVFLTEEQYLSHMREVHTISFTEPQLRVLAERNGRPIGPMLEFCPICGTDEVTTSLEEHVVGHLRLLALRSLPPYEDEGSDISGGDRGSSGASKPASRTTIKEDPERYRRPTFQDSGGHEDNDQVPWDTDPSWEVLRRPFDDRSRKHVAQPEWGFLTKAGDAKLETPEDDPIVQSMLKYAFAETGRNKTPSSQPDGNAPANHSRPSQPDVTDDKSVDEEPGDGTGPSQNLDTGKSSAKRGWGGDDRQSSDGYSESEDDRAEDTEEDMTMRIAHALKGPGDPNTAVLIDILPNLTHEQVMELRIDYKRVVKTGPERKGVNVAKHIRLVLKDWYDDFMKVSYATVLGQWESEAYWINSWSQSDVNRRELLIEALMGRTNDEIAAIKDAFKDKRYDNSLTKALERELKEDNFKCAVMEVLRETRMEYGESGLLPVDKDLAEEDVNLLREAILSNTSGETAILSCVTQRSESHLREVLRLYELRYRESFARQALKKAGNMVGEVIAHILNGVINRPARDASLLHHALTISGVGPLRRDLLTSRLVRYHWDRVHMTAVKKAFFERYQTHLLDAVVKSTDGDWGLFCQGLCQCGDGEEAKAEAKDERDGQRLVTRLYRI